MNTQETLDALKAATAGDVQKSVTTATGLTAYDLQAPAKHLYPVYTPLRNIIPRVGGGRGLATNWRVIRGLTGSGYNNIPWIPEGQRSGRMSYTVTPKAANYVTMGEEDSVTFEAINAGVGFEDIKARATLRLLQKFMAKEESAILLGNNSVALGTPSAPTLGAAGSGATLPAATYSVIVVALTGEGFMNSSVANGVATSMTVTGADGATYTAKGGSSQKSAAATQAITLGQTLTCTATMIRGAVAYAWYVGLAGSEKLEAITTVNRTTFTAPLAGTGQAATAITADCSNNSGYAYDGLLTSALESSSEAYFKQLAAGNTGLTSSGSGSITEIDTMLRTMWDTFQLSPTMILCNSQELQNMTAKVMMNSSTSLLSINNNDPKMPLALTAGNVVNRYYNPYTPNGGQIIPVMIHPNLPPGTLLGWSNELPLVYQNAEVGNVAEIKTRQDYYQIEWPLRTRQREMGVYCEAVLANYAPFAMGVITNIGNG